MAETFISKRLIKPGGWTTVEVGTYGDRDVVRKTYVLEQIDRFHAERSNLASMGRSGFEGYVDSVHEDVGARELYYPFIEGVDGYAALGASGDARATLGSLFHAMSLEMRCMERNGEDIPFVFIPEGHKETDDPLCYVKLLAGNQGNIISSGLAGKVGALLGSVKPNVAWGRYDPELANFVVDTHGQVHHIDYEAMASQDLLFPFAYTLVHLGLRENGGLEQIGGLVGGVQLARDVVRSDLGDSFEARMLLSLAEVCGYVALETLNLFDHPLSPELDARVKKSVAMLDEVLN